MIFEMHSPEQVFFGPGVRYKTPSLLPEGNLLIICGRHSEKRIEKELLPRLSGRQVRICSAFPAEAPLDKADEVLEEARKLKISSIIGWGGGSCIDVAKSVAAVLDSSYTLTEVFRKDIQLPERKCFFAAVPTTAGTAAEMTPNAVLCDPETNIKKSIRGKSMFADAALIDPELISDAPDEVLFGSGFDALTQGIESVISNRADAMTRMLALEGSALTWQGLELVCEGRKDEAAFPLARGCMLSGAAFVRSGLGAAHGVGHPISGLRGVPHGVCCAILLVEVLKVNLPECRDAMEQLALRLHRSSPEQLIEDIALLRRKCRLPEDFKKWGLCRDDFDFVVKNCRSGSMKSNPRDLCDQEVVELLERLI